MRPHLVVTSATPHVGGAYASARWCVPAWTAACSRSFPTAAASGATNPRPVLPASRGPAPSGSPRPGPRSVAPSDVTRGARSHDKSGGPAV